MAHIRFCHFDPVAAARSPQKRLVRSAGAQGQAVIPDLIILDLAMPVMNGRHAAREVSQLLPSVPIVLYSMYAAPQVELEAKKVGSGRGAENRSAPPIVANR